MNGQPVLGETKNKKSRVVTLPRFLVDELYRHLEQYPPGPSGLVFAGPKDAPLNRTNFRNRIWLPALKAAGIAQPWPRVHDLRHTAVALAIATGAHVKEVQARAGHSSITVTLDRYGHLFPGQDEALAQRLDDLHSGAVLVQSWSEAPTPLQRAEGT